MPAWSQNAGIWERPIGSAEFRIAALLLTILGFAVTFWSVQKGPESVGTYLLAGFVFAMLLNVIFHVAATIALREYAPGIVTAVLLNVPVMGYLLRLLFQEHWVTWPRVLLALIGVPLTILLLIPVLLWVGRLF